MLDRIDWINVTLPRTFPETASEWKLSVKAALIAAA